MLNLLYYEQKFQERKINGNENSRNGKFHGTKVPWSRKVYGTLAPWTFHSLCGTFTLRCEKSCGKVLLPFTDGTSEHWQCHFGNGISWEGN